MLEDMWARWAALGRSLAPEEWERPTRLGTWNVKAAYAHHSLYPAGLRFLAGSAVDGEPTWDSAAAMLAAFNAPGGIAHGMAQQVADAADAAAASQPTADLVAAFDLAPEAIAAARATGAATVVDYFGIGRLRLGDVLDVGLLEATVHLLDIDRALGREPSPSEAALARVRDVLAAMVPAVAFVEAAAGRGADVLPVLC